MIKCGDEERKKFWYVRSCSPAASLASDPNAGVKERPPDAPKVKKPSRKKQMATASAQAVEETRDEEPEVDSLSSSALNTMAAAIQSSSSLRFVFTKVMLVPRRRRT